MTKNNFIENFMLPSNLMNSSKDHIRNIDFREITLPKNTIYIDFASSTPLDTRVFQEMIPWMLGYFANASNRSHPMGKITEYAITQARISIAKIFNVSQNEVIFTSSATESNNLLLRGLVEDPLRKRKKIVYCATEHSSIIVTAKKILDHYSKVFDIEIKSIPVDMNGQIIMDEAEKIIDKNTLCVCIMDVNNETGIIQTQLQKIKVLCQKAETILHVDAAQGFARSTCIACDVDYDTATISSSKIYGPKGIAALIVKKRRPFIRIEAQLTGGGHEFNIRSSSLNNAAIIGFAKACSLQKKEAQMRIMHYKKMEEAFCDEIQQHILAHFFGNNTEKVPGIITLYFSGVNASNLLEKSKIVCASISSEYKTLQEIGSHVLDAMGVALEHSLSSFRVSFGLTNSEDEVREAARILAKTAIKLKRDSVILT
ncbi:cysteine desulfurase family protein [Fluviispira multicolorata]|uniref:Aminotransferase class V-fold PLP-dependent enzyme n=1 Tax=Fluviispira multicolorata TaxID=2654512 RepID=A0A833JC32_9BACT|nr:aminotransferase class V-fold PLP-dependent enzyme [Fluviispira multicolorata]KAB8029191.1 aminotransferase class V-fold PLP-dependent enzyme [Fluviispira multicolorata]